MTAAAPPSDEITVDDVGVRRLANQFTGDGDGARRFAELARLALQRGGSKRKAHLTKHMRDALKHLDRAARLDVIHICDDRDSLHAVYEDGSHDLAAEAPPTSKTLEDTDHTPVHLEGKEGDSPLVLAVDGSYGLAAVASPTLQTKCLHFAAAAGALDTVHDLLDDGADFTCPDLFGRVALHHAAAGGKIEIVRLLLTRGAIATLPDKDGLLPELPRQRP